MSKKKEEKPKLLCLDCEKPIVNKIGGRQKLYCNSLCRGRFFAKKISAGKDAEARGGRAKELWDELQGLLNGKEPLANTREQFLYATSDTDGSIKVKKSTTPVSATVTVNKKPSPMTVQQIKELCPKNLKGLDRTEWINQEKKKHGL